MRPKTPFLTSSLWRINTHHPLLISDIVTQYQHFDIPYFKLNYFNLEVQHSVHQKVLEKNGYVHAGKDSLGELLSLLERGWTNFGALRLSVLQYTPELLNDFHLPSFCEVFLSKKFTWMFNGEGTKVKMGHVNKCSLTLQIDGRQFYKIEHPMLDLSYEGILTAGNTLFIPQGFVCTWIGIEAGTALQVGLR